MMHTDFKIIDGSGLSEKELKVAIANFPHFTIINRNSTGHVTGYAGSLYAELEWIAKRLNFSFLMEVEEGFGVLSTNGNLSTGLIGRLHRAEVDLACSPYTGLIARNAMELSVYTGGYPWGMLEKYPIGKSSMYGIFEIFSLKVWVMFLLSIIAMTGYLYMAFTFKKKIFHFYETHFGNRFSSIGEIFTCTFGIIVNQGGGFKRSDGITAVTWCLAAFTFVQIYSSCLTSYTSLVFQRPGVVTFENLATSRRHEVFTVKYTFAERLFLEASSGTMKGIGDKLRSCGEKCRLKSYNDASTKEMMMVLSGSHVMILPDIMCDFFMTKTKINRQQCGLTMGKDMIGFLNTHMGAPKNSPYVKELNKESLWWMAFGFGNYWDNKLSPRSKECRLNYNNGDESVQVVDKARLKLEQFYLAFLILFFGYCLALMQFIRERIINHRRSRLAQQSISVSIQQN